MKENQMYEIKKDIPVSPQERTREWPFKDMDVDDCVDIKDISIWKTASRYAHITGARKDWQFSTKWMGKFGRIRRVR